MLKQLLLWQLNIVKNDIMNIRFFSPPPTGEKIQNYQYLIAVVIMWRSFSCPTRARS